MRPYISFVSVRPTLLYFCSSATSLSMLSIFSYVLDDPGSILGSGPCFFLVSKTSSPLFSGFWGVFPQG